MMIKKQLGVLAASVVLGTLSSQAMAAAVTQSGVAGLNEPGSETCDGALTGAPFTCHVGTDSGVFAYAYDDTGVNGSYLFNLTELNATITVDFLLGGGSFSVDLSSFLDFDISNYNQWGLVAGSRDSRTGGTGLEDASGYIGGLFSIQQGLTPGVAEGQTVGEAIGIVGTIDQVLANTGAATGPVAAGAVGDVLSDAQNGVNSLYGDLTATPISSVADIYFLGVNCDGAGDGDPCGPSGIDGTVLEQFGTGELTQTSLNVVGPPSSEIPVPAAAWLFGSALLGLSAIRRRA